MEQLSQADWAWIAPMFVGIWATLLALKWWRRKPEVPPTCDDCYRSDGTHDPDVEH